MEVRIFFYFGFKIGGSYGNWGKSLQYNDNSYLCDYQINNHQNSQLCTNSIVKYKKPYYYTMGLAYQFAGFSASLTSLNSNFQNNHYQALSFGGDYKYSKNLLPYFELTKFEFNVDKHSLNLNNDQANLDNKAMQSKNNKGYIFLIGILYSF